MSAEESLLAAVATWPKGIRPIVHWSESPPEELGKNAPAHSDFVGQFGPMVLHGLEGKVDVMVRSTSTCPALRRLASPVAQQRTFVCFPL